VIDRLQLCIFLAVTVTGTAPDPGDTRPTDGRPVTGTASILINAPHIFEFVDQDQIKRAIVGDTAS